MSAVSNKRRTHCIQNKPHLYFHRYPSGLGFWRVRKPNHWRSPVDVRAVMNAAYKHANKLNSEQQNHD